MITAKDVVQRLMDEGAEDTLGYEPGAHDPNGTQWDSAVPVPRERRRPVEINPQAAHDAATFSPGSAYHYAEDVLHGRFPEGEKLIATSPTWAMLYARNILHGPFPAAEPMLLKKASYIAGYAFAIDRPWPKGEAVLKKMAKSDRVAKFWYDGYRRKFAAQPAGLGRV